MIKLNAIPLDYEPRQKILPKLPQYVRPDGGHEPEMSWFDSAFLCGLLKICRPKKILEIGVAGGATTAIILQALEDIGTPYEMHSVDVAEKFYLDSKLPTAFMAMYALQNNLFASPRSTLKGKHAFHLGKVLPQVIDSIGGDIDFVILDTIHTMPGEGLDFLAVLPYLTPEAVVVLHDVAENHRLVNQADQHATTVLFSAVTAEKFLNWFPETPEVKWYPFKYPNIAAFKVNEQTRANIENVFLTMILRWAYMPSEEEIVLYRNHYRRFYSDTLCQIFQEAIDMNAYNFHLAQRR